MEDLKKKRSILCLVIPTAMVILAAFFLGSVMLIIDQKQRFIEWHINEAIQLQVSKSTSTTCERPCKPDGSEVLPRGIVSRTSNLEMRPLWGSPNRKRNPRSPMSLLAMAVGIKQKENVNKIVKKFPLTDFVIMLFHYDGNVDQWSDLHWSKQAIHISAVNQTKWWFAKRFLHPDVISDYDYLFLWDEDLGVEHFDAIRYLSIIRKEGLHISQPAIDREKSEVHHKITARVKGSMVHRRTYGVAARTNCSENSTAPPCTGWVEMMAPIFSRESWRCVWFMIQNDLIHAWGLDFLLGYCAQGDRRKNVGIVDSEYLIHQGIPTLGGSAANKILPNRGPEVPGPAPHLNARDAVRKQSYEELAKFKNRWKKAITEDECWVDPFQQPQQQAAK